MYTMHVHTYARMRTFVSIFYAHQFSFIRIRMSFSGEKAKVHFSSIFYGWFFCFSFSCHDRDVRWPISHYCSLIKLYQKKSIRVNVILKWKLKTHKKIIWSKKEVEVDVVWETRLRRRAFSLFNEKNRFFRMWFGDIRHFFGLWFSVVWFGLVYLFLFIAEERKNGTMTMASTVGHLMIRSFEWTISIEFVRAAARKHQNWVIQIGVDRFIDYNYDYFLLCAFC